MSTTITVYQSRKSLRVVAGEHKPHSDSKRDRVAVYPSAQLAYSTETDIAVQMAILRIDPTAADGAPVSTLKRARFSIDADGRMYDRVAKRAVADDDDLMAHAAGDVFEGRDGFVTSPHDKRPHCPDCGKIGERAGHMDCEFPQDH